MKVQLVEAVSVARQWLELDPGTDSRMSDDIETELDVFDAAEAMQDWRGCLRACTRIAHVWASNDTSGFEELKAAVEAMRNGLHLYEVMPACLVANHKAAGNWGHYPSNGAVRVLAASGLDEASNVKMIRAATAADMTDYLIDTDGTYITSL